MFRSPRILSPVPSRAELAGTITTADEISVDCTKYGCPRWVIRNITSANDLRDAPHHQFAKKVSYGFHVNSFPTQTTKPVCLDVSQPWKFGTQEARKFSYGISKRLVVYHVSFQSAAFARTFKWFLDYTVYVEQIEILHFFLSAILINQNLLIYFSVAVYF